MAINIELVAETIKRGSWNLGVTVPKIYENHQVDSVAIKMGSIVEAVPVNKTRERSSLDARKQRTGVLLFRIGLEEFEVTDYGFIAAGIGYVERSQAGAPTSTNEDSEEPKVPKQFKDYKKDPYYGSSPAVQFWVARRR